MANRKPRQPSRAPAVVMLVVALGVVAALAAYIKLAPADRVPQEERRPDAVSDLQGGRRSHPAGPTIDVPIPSFVNGELTFQPSREAVPDGEEPRAYAVNAFLQASRIADSSVRVLGVDLKDGIARLDFSDGFEQSQGSMDEATLVKGIRAALGQFPDVQSVEFYVSGKRVDELGHLDLSEPQDVIRPSDWAPKPTAEPPTSPNS